MVIMQHEKMKDERNLTMKPTKVILKDASYLHSKTSITFILKDVVIEDNEIYYFDTSATFEDQEVEFEFALLIVTLTI